VIVKVKSKKDENIKIMNGEAVHKLFWAWTSQSSSVSERMNDLEWNSGIEGVFLFEIL
jgi:hypothetical protein